MTPPEESVTVPVSAPVAAVWADKGTVISSKRHKHTRADRAFFIAVELLSKTIWCGNLISLLETLD
jgi:hypothetical protein